MQIIAIPFAYVLKFCYWLTDKYAIALILFSLIMTLLFAFVNYKQRKAIQDQARIKPMVNALRKRYEGRNDVYARNEFSNELMALYKKEKVSAAAGCLPMLIQLLIVVILFTLVQNPLTYLCDVSAKELTNLNAEIYTLIGEGAINVDANIKSIYESALAAKGAESFTINEFQTYSVLRDNSATFAEFIKANPLPDFKLFGIDLSYVPSFKSILILIPILATVIPFATTLLMKKFGQTTENDTADASTNPQAAKTMNTMLYITPVITFMACLNFQAIIGLYWIYRSVFSSLLQVVVNKLMPIPKYTPEEEAAIEAEFNKDYVFTAPAAEKKRSLHYIDADDYEDDDTEDTDNGEYEADGDEKPAVTTAMPERRRYDKDGNKIRSLHFIDEEDEEEAVTEKDAEDRKD